MRFVSSWPLLGTGHMSDSPNSFCGGCTSRVGVFTSIFGLSQLRRPVLTPKGLASHLAIRSFFFQICTVAAKIFVHLRSQKKISDLRKKIAETRQNCNSILHTPSHGLCKGSTFQDLLPFADEVPAQRSETGAPQKLHLVKQKLGTTQMINHEMLPGCPSCVCGYFEKATLSHEFCKRFRFAATFHL